MEKYPYDELIETIAKKMKEYENARLGYAIFENLNKE